MSLLAVLACARDPATVPADGGDDAPTYSSIVEPDLHPTIQVTMNANGGSATNTRETFLNVGNVNPTRFGKLFTIPVDGDQYAQPLYLGGVRMSDGEKHNVVFVATEHDSVYAFDADDGSTTPLWKTRLGESVPVPNPWFGTIKAPEKACKSQAPNMNESGITSTPVIDPATGTIYVVALDEDDSRTVPGQTCVHTDPSSSDYCTTYTCSEPSITYRLHALDLTTGGERAGSPVTIAAKVDAAGLANDDEDDGAIRFDARVSLQRTALLLDYGTIYFATASYSDVARYHGWVFAYDAASLTRKSVFNDTPGGEFGGIWMSGRPMISDHAGYVYLVTGNGTFDSNVDGGVDYGDSVLKLDAQTLKVVDWFSPFLSDYRGHNFLDSFDDDLGSAGATFIPNTTLLLASGKLGKGYIVDTAEMGHWSPTRDNVVQTVRLAWRFDATECGTPYASWIYGTPAIWEGPDGTHVYVWGSADYLRDYVLDGNGLFRTQGICFCGPGWSLHEGDDAFTVDVSDPACAVPSSKSPDSIEALTGGVVSVSSNGKEAGTGIVWASRPVSGDPTARSVPGALEAYDATFLTVPIWTSTENAERDALGKWAKFVPPTVANGKVYMGTQSGELVVYGLLPGK